MEVRLFGELEVVGSDGTMLPIRGAKQRTLLAMLALAHGQPVSADRLIDGMWGEDPPGNPANALQAQVAQLRRTLGGPAVVTTGAGYALGIPAEAIDIVRFERMVGTGRRDLESGDAASAAAILHDALSLRRGELLGEFVDSDFAQPERARVDELVLQALEARADAELALGHHDAVISELDVLCHAHPVRERLWELRMLALYRAGRQAEALRAYADARAHLVEQLGIEPGMGLRDLEARVLAQDAALAPAPAHPSVAGNIRQPTSAFVGRAHELAVVRRALEAARLVTLTGPGGVGKTRLATEVALALRGCYRDGAWFAELAGVTEPEGVAPAVALALRASGTGEHAASTDELIEQHLAGRSVLLVLDNCEHVIGAAAALAERLVGATEGLRVLATSREPLALPGEVLIPLAGLDAPSAAELFRDRARAVQPSFADDGVAQSLVDEVCERLDALPLAIELAAARLRALPLATLASRLDDRFRLLTAGARTALPRHQTLRAVVDWSYDLLFEDERCLFSRLAVFTGGCSLDAVETVCADESLARDDVLDVLTRLVDKSLVVADVSGAEPRYSQLQTLWDYARERLTGLDDADAVGARHARYYVALARGATAGLRSRDAGEWSARLEADAENLRASFEWFVAHGDAASALALAGSLAWWWFLRSDSAEATRWLGEALTLAGEPSAKHGAALAWQALHSANVGSATASLLADARHGVAELRAFDATAELPDGLMIVCELCNRLGDFDGALAALGEAYGLLEDSAEQWALGVCDILAAENLAALGRPADAERAARAGVERLQAIGERSMVIEGLGVLAGLQESRGRLDAAASAFEGLVTSAQAAGLAHFETLWLMRLGALRARLGDDVSAERLFSDALTTSRRPTFTAMALLGCAGAARRRGDLGSARRSLDEALALYDRIDLPKGVAATLVGLAWWAISSGDLAAARDLAAQAVESATLSADPVLQLSAATAEAAVALAESATQASRDRLASLLEERDTMAAARFARVLGGSFVATLDEPDVAAFAAAHGVTPQRSTDW